MLTSGALRPIIGTTLPLQQVPQDFEQLEKGVGNAKLVLIIDQLIYIILSHSLKLNAALVN
ncbi:hypothetical protein CIB87_06785 [Priestia megaterium]|uniref:Uncharacterized protein n=1 Tax=Priestia megaterium TaxID=1404 RepID=A0AA86I3F9_PRIMG|nr:hypothetical protein [Priestia megaterium]AXI28726.1 hypothetical protein CIB87_06785 [Priestia megaterium]